MSFGDILLYLIIALIIYVVAKRIYLSRTIKSYSASEVKDRIKNRDSILLDVRNPDERKKDFIKGSIHIPLYDLKSRAEELTKFRDKEIICYCRSGNRSMKAAGILKSKGINAANMKGGMMRWQS